jgi:hypothetical protein
VEIPEDLCRRAREAVQQLDSIEQRMCSLEGHAKQVETMPAQVKELRHDLNNALTVIRMLMAEVDQRVPVETPGKKGGK